MSAVLHNTFMIHRHRKFSASELSEAAVPEGIGRIFLGAFYEMLLQGRYIYLCIVIEDLLDYEVLKGKAYILLIRFS